MFSFHLSFHIVFSTIFHSLFLSVSPCVCFRRWMSKQLPDGVVLLSATGGHLTGQICWEGTLRPPGATQPPVGAAGEAVTLIFGAPRHIGTLTRRAWRPSKRPPIISTMQPTEAPTPPPNLLLYLGRQGGVGSMGQMFTGSRTCSCRCSLPATRRTELKS